MESMESETNPDSLGLMQGAQHPQAPVDDSTLPQGTDAPGMQEEWLLVVLGLTEGRTKIAGESSLLGTCAVCADDAAKC